MEPGSFEEKMRQKFEGQEIAAPSSIWSNVKGSLDVAMLAIHRSRAKQYLVIAVAAVFLAFLSFAFLLLDPGPVEEYHANEPAFNALTGDNPSVSGISTPVVGKKSMPLLSFVFLDRAAAEEKTHEKYLMGTNLSMADLSVNRELSVFHVRKKMPELMPSHDLQRDIYRYETLSGLSVVSKPRKLQEKRVWAGLEAGAGTVYGNLNSSASLSAAIDNAGLASSSGLQDFVNPTKSVSQNVSTGTSRTFGFDVGMQVGKKWTVESGFSLTKLQKSTQASINVLDVYTVDRQTFGASGLETGNPEYVADNLSRDKMEVRESFEKAVQIESRMQFASVPVKAGYFLIQKRISLRLNAGIAANYLLGGSVSDPTNQVFNTSDPNLYNNWSFDGLSGLELGVSIFDRFDFTLEPNYRYAIVPVSKSATVPSRFMVQTGFRYRFR